MPKRGPAFVQHLTAVSLALVAVPALLNASPLPLSYSGRVTTTGGQALAGSVDLQVQFFGSATGNDSLRATPLTFPGIALSDGVFQIDLALSAADVQQIFADGSREVWLQITDVTHQKTYARQRFTPVPLALRVPIDGTSITYDANGALKIGNVDELQGKPVDATAPIINQVLQWDGSQWAPATVGGVGTPESTTASSSGTGAAVFKVQNTYDLVFRRLNAGNGITVTQNADDVTIAATGATTNTANEIVKRDASGNFAAGTITANLTGNVTGNVSGNVSGTAANVTGTVAVANGGTGLTAAPSNGQLPIGNGTGYTLATITGGSGINVSNGAGTIQVAADLSSRVAKAGDTMTGALLLPADGLVVGTTQLVASSSRIGIGTASPGSTLDVKGTLRLSGATSGYVGFAPAAAAGSTTYTLPAADGSNGQMLVTNGSGTLGWRSDSFVSGEARGLVIKNNAGALTSRVDVTAREIILQDASGAPLRVTNVSVSPAITASGANGLDAGSEAASTWYYVWLISDGTTTAGLLSTSSTAPTMPGSYIYKSLVGAVYNDSSSNFPKFHQTGRKVYLLTTPSVLSNGTAAALTSLSLTTLVPPIAATALITSYCSWYAQPNGNNCALSADGVYDFTWTTSAYNATYANTDNDYSFIEIPLITPQTLWYRVTGYGSSYLTLNGFTLD